MNHVMVDLETLGTDPDCAFISIGAVKFNPFTGEIDKVDSFYRRVDWESAIENRSVKASTLKWWLQQSESARIEVCKDGYALPRVLEEFRNWFPSGGVIWGNGATFDVSILQDAYKRNFYLKTAPWEFWNVHDVRTICALAEGIIDKKSVPFEGIPHYALDDAIHQAKYVSTMWQKLRG